MTCIQYLVISLETSLGRSLCNTWNKFRIWGVQEICKTGAEPITEVLKHRVKNYDRQISKSRATADSLANSQKALFIRTQGLRCLSSGLRMEAGKR